MALVRTATIPVIAALVALLSACTEPSEVGSSASPIATRPGAAVQAPNLIGMSLRRALHTLQAAGLEWRVRDTIRPGAAQELGKVVVQCPAAGSAVPGGRVNVIYASTGNTVELMRGATARDLACASNWTR